MGADRDDLLAIDNDIRGARVLPGSVEQIAAVEEGPGHRWTLLPVTSGVGYACGRQRASFQRRPGAPTSVKKGGRATKNQL